MDEAFHYLITRKKDLVLTEASQDIAQIRAVNHICRGRNSHDWWRCPPRKPSMALPSTPPGDTQTCTTRRCDAMRPAGSR
eukprot:SAG31_NODE_29176_length_399_cov_1.206667_1_plen_79_part_10